MNAGGRWTTCERSESRLRSTVVQTAFNRPASPTNVSGNPSARLLPWPVQARLRPVDPPHCLALVSLAGVASAAVHASLQTVCNPAVKGACAAGKDPPSEAPRQQHAPLHAWTRSVYVHRHPSAQFPAAGSHGLRGAVDLSPLAPGSPPRRALEAVRMLRWNGDTTFSSV